MASDLPDISHQAIQIELLYFFLAMVTYTQRLMRTTTKHADAFEGICVSADGWQLDYPDQAFRQFRMHLLFCLKNVYDYMDEGNYYRLYLA